MDKKTGAELIAEERQRQMDKEGWTAKHDDRHTDCSIVLAAISYAAAAIGKDLGDLWPWGQKFDKRDKHAPLRCLVIAGALLAAEIDRRLRIEIPDHGLARGCFPSDRGGV